MKNLESITPEQKAALADLLAGLVEAEAAYNGNCASLVDGLTNFRRLYETSPPTVNLDQHSASQTFAPLADKAKGLV